MCRWKFTSISLAVSIIVASSAAAAPFVVAKNTSLVAAPSADAPQIVPLAQGTLVEVTHQAGTYWRVETAGKTGYAPADALRQSQTKGGPLVPLMVMAATPLGKIVIAESIGWFQKILGIDGKPMGKADEAISIGKELIVLAKEIGGWLKVKDESGKIGYVKDGAGVVYLQPVSYAGAQVSGIWKDSKPIPTDASALTLQVQVRKMDGTPVPPGATLRLGDEYRIYVTTSADAYVRITAETPDAGHVCQYYPNQFPGTQTSLLFKAGHTYSTELLPQGVNFKVSEPIGEKDLLRVEATTAAPFHYVLAGDGCAPTVSFKGGGFSVAGDVKNPTAQVVVEYFFYTTK